MQVIKRENNLEEYDLAKIENAIFKASNEVKEREMAELVAEEVSDLVDQKIFDIYSDNKYPTVEDIQEIVEDTLIEENYSKIAKRYIIYRANRDKVRGKKKESILTDDFLRKYKHKPNPFPTELGEFIYYRTYSRWLPEEQRREYWWETVRRAVEYNCSLAPTSRKEAEKLYDNVYHMRQFLAGKILPLIA